MKQFKLDIINRMVEKHAEQRIVSLRETANELGYNHMSAQDCRDIISKLKNVQGAKLIRLMNTPHDSLFCSLCLVDECVSFE